MHQSKVLEFYRLDPSLQRHDFYYCYKCGYLFTQQYERERMAEMSKRSEDEPFFIHCTSLRYAPTRPQWWQWFYPRVAMYAFKVIMARVIAPWAQVRGHWRIYDLSLLLASNKVTQ
jgi:hypothetical protein